MTLADLIAARIQQDGPISVADYMTDCLLHPTFGYYATRDPLGAAGDFITAPEISQMFGELIGLALAQAWIDQGRPKPFAVAELGPGRGTLMMDLLRATHSVPGFHDAARIQLVEASASFRAQQAKALHGHDPIWPATADDLPDLPLFLIANEFFDALPVRQFLRDGAGWRERRIGLEGDTLNFRIGPAVPVPMLAHRHDDTADGDLVELCPAAAPIVSAIGTRIATHGGAALIVDYGDWLSLGDTLQALQQHQPCGLFDNPGQADLSTQVDFEALAQAAAAAGCAFTRLTPQGVFLERLGITARARALAANSNGANADAVALSHRRLTHPDEMGNLFKVIGLYPTSAKPPPGLEP